MKKSNNLLEKPVIEENIENVPNILLT